MPGFNIVHILPPGNATTMGQFDVSRLLNLSFGSLGYSVTFQINQFEASSTNIVVGYEQLAAFPSPAEYRCIPYQLEQLGVGGAPITPNFLAMLQSAAEVWDYDPRNIEVLKRSGIENVRHLPLGYHHELASIPQREEDVDVLFYGLVNDRRKAILDQLERKCRVRALEFVYGNQRDEWISRSKIVLNMHYYPAQMAEQVRVSYLLNNSRCVVSERSSWDPLGRWCAVADYDKLVNTCLDLLADEPRRQQIISNARDGFRELSMPDQLRRVAEQHL